MNKILLSLTLIAMAMTLQAKEYKQVLVDGVRWTDHVLKPNNRRLEFNSSSGFAYQIVGDTVIYDKRCMIVEERHITRPEKSPTYSYWYEEDGRLFTFRDDTLWDIIKDKPEMMAQHERYYPFFLKMDMNLEKGESPYASSLSVIHIDSIEIHGQLRKRISLGESGRVVCRWIEGIMPENDSNDMYSGWWPIPVSGRITGITSYACDNFTVDATIFGAMGNTVMEDKIWEYEGCISDHNEAMRTGLSGECFFSGWHEINGISYKQLNCYHDKDSGVDKIAFLREQDRRVYIAIPAGNETDFTNMEEGAEALLYDFNANPGDSYTSLNFCNLNDMEPQPVVVTVVDTCRMTVGNKLMKCQIVKTENSDVELTVVEGIGIVNGGWLHRPSWTNTGVAENKAGISQLNNVRNRFRMDTWLEDEIIFKNGECRWKPQLIRHDRVWEYVMPVKGESSSSIYCRMKFDGKKEVNGKMYDKFITIDTKKVERTIEGSDTICTMTYLPYEYVERLMREENNTVYYLSQAETDLPAGGDRFNAATWDFNRPITEHAFYDFSPPIGYSFFGTVCLDYTTNFWIQEISEAVIDGKSCRLLYAPHYVEGEDSAYPYPSLYFLESVGTIGKGASMTYIPTDDANDDWFTLSRVFNGGGKQIFPIEGQTYPLGWDSGFIPEEEGTFILTSSGIKGCTASTSNSISYINGTVSSHGNLILIFDIAGNLVKKGSDSLQTDDLLPGIYIAKAIGSNGTLRINVK